MLKTLTNSIPEIPEMTPNRSRINSVITIATDGSCLRNPGGATGWAWIDDTYRWDAGGSVSRHGTNQIAELHAFYEALRAHRDDHDILILSDSEYALKCATTWRHGWERKQGRTAKGAPVRYYAKIKLIWALLDERSNNGYRTQLEWVKAHSGHRLNEQADLRAHKAAQLAKKKNRDLNRAELNIADPVRPRTFSV